MSVLGQSLVRAVSKSYRNQWSFFSNKRSFFAFFTLITSMDHIPFIQAIETQVHCIYFFLQIFQHFLMAMRIFQRLVDLVEAPG